MTEHGYAITREGQNHEKENARNFDEERPDFTPASASRGPDYT